MAFKILNLGSIGNLKKDLMTCCGVTVEFVGVFGILLLIAGTLQMGSGVYFMLTLPVFSVASNIWTGVISGLTGTVLTYYGCSDQARRRPYVLFTFCIVAIVANVANIVITQVGDKTLNVFNEESFLSNLDDAKMFTLKTGVWITTGATVLSLASSFILANYLFCGELKGRGEADKPTPLLKTISEEILQKTSRPKSKKGGSPNRFFPPSRLTHDSKAENARPNAVGLWIPWKEIESAHPIYSTQQKELTFGERQSKDISFGGGSSLKHLSGEGVGLRNNYCRPNTLFRNGVVNLGATIDDDSVLVDNGYSYKQKSESKTLGRFEKNYKFDDQQRFSTFKPRKKSRVSSSKLQGRESDISVHHKDIEKAINLKEVNQEQYDERQGIDNIDVDIELLETNKVVNKIVDQISSDEKDLCSSQDKIDIENEINDESKECKEKSVDNFSSSDATRNNSESWMNVLPSVFTNIMEISDFNEFINNLLTQDNTDTTVEKISDQSERDQISKKQQTTDVEEIPEEIETKQHSQVSKREDSTNQNKFRRSSPHRSKRLKRPNQKPPLPPKPETTQSTTEQNLH